MNNSVRIVRVQYTLCPNADPSHWILFDVETVVRPDIQCLFCGPKAIVKRRYLVKRGLVSRDERDKGYALSEPQKEVV
jgi:hypothetical protein